MLRARLDVSLWTVETASYRSLDIRGMTRPHWIVSHVLMGEVTTETCGVRNEARAGDVMIHPPRLPFAEFASESGTHQWCAFDATLVDPDADAGSPDLLTRHPVAPIVPLGGHRDPFVRTFDALEAAHKTDDALRASSLLGLLLAEVLNAWRDAGSLPRPEAMRTPQGRFAELLAYMETHLVERITRDDLARRAFLHPGYFDRAFRAAHGMPPLRLLQEMRLTRARRLLETTGNTLDAVARASGLGDAARLGRLFRARYGIAPGAYRSQVQAARGSYLSG